jgi:hypothetical protein
MAEVVSVSEGWVKILGRVVARLEEGEAMRGLSFRLGLGFMLPSLALAFNIF